MRFNRKVFFDGVKERLDPSLTQSQVDGLEFLLSKVENDELWTDIRHIAYMLSTVFHETAGSFQPVVEGYYLAKTNPPDYSGKTKRVKDFQKTLRYYPYFGRGYVQLTWKTNYEKAGKAFGVDLVNKPELALQPDIAFKCLGGMFKGWYGAKLGTYINAEKTDYVNARRCVNILDKAGLIAGYARSFEKILKSSAAKSNGDSAKTTSSSDGTNTTGQEIPPPPPIETKHTEETEIEKDGETVSAKTTTTSETVTLKSVGTSLWTKFLALLAAITGMGINAGTIIETRLSELTLNQVLFTAMGITLIVLAVFYYRKRQEAADHKDKMLIEKAADPQLNTVEMKRRGWIKWS